MGINTSSADPGHRRIPRSKLIGRKSASTANAARYASIHVLPLAAFILIQESQALSIFAGSGSTRTRSSATG
jgi:hypothetical protein